MANDRVRKPAGALSGRMLLVLLAVVAAGWGVGQVVGRLTPIGIDVGANPALAAILSDGGGPVDAPADATLTLVVFSDYQCPACRLAHPALAAALRADGHVRVVHRDWPIFGPRSERAARVAIAADRQSIHRALDDILMRERRPLDDAVLRQAVEQAGGDWARLLADLAAHGPAIDRRLAANRAQAAALRIPGTPAYLAGDILLIGAASEPDFARLFARARR